MRQLTTGGSLLKNGGPKMVNGIAGGQLNGSQRNGSNSHTAAAGTAGTSRHTELRQLLRSALEGSRVGDAAGNQLSSRQEMQAALPRWKRALDFALIVLTLPIWWPLMLLLALWVAITSPGPIFYRQPRIGFKGRRFMIVKFRTMKVNAETRSHETYLEQLMVSDRPMVKLDATGDPRLILGGKFLRAIGVDELPQIFNVLRGEMSVVGPRPCTVREFECYAPQDRKRLDALPGLTGYWQVNGKNRTTFRQMVEMDVFYAKNLSLGLDLKIIARTFPAIAAQLADLWQSQPGGAAASASSVTNS